MKIAVDEQDICWIFTAVCIAEEGLDVLCIDIN